MAIKFKINERKAVESVLWLIKRGESDMYKIFKMLFTAEKYHLNKYGRPITGQQYLAMPLGTVPSWIYDVGIHQIGIGFYKAGRVLVAERDYIRKFFSESDIEALEFGYKEYETLDFTSVKNKNHKDPAWLYTWARRGISKRKPIPFEKLIDEAWLRKELKELSAFMVI